MPTYDYECLKCDAKFEAFQKMSDEPLKKCPTCEGKVKRLIGSGAGVIFKGKGFYATDYKKKDSSSAKSADPSSPSPSPSPCSGCKNSACDQASKTE